MARTKAQRDARRKAAAKRKLRTVHDKINDLAGLLTEREVFLSPEVRKYLQNKLQFLCKECGIPNIRLKIGWEPENLHFVAATNNHLILVNAAHPLIQEGNRPQSFKKLCGIIAHEVGHVLFTNFSARKIYMTGWLDGNPSLPSVPLELHDNLKQLKEFLKGERGLVSNPDPAMANREALCSVIAGIDNSLEDGREENLFSQYCFDHKTFYEGLVEVVRFQKSKNITLPDLLIKYNSEELTTFQALDSMILHYSRFSEINGYDNKAHKNLPLVKIFRGIEEYCDAIIESTSCTDKFNALTMIIIILFPYIEEFILKMDEQRQLLSEKAKSLSEKLKETMESGAGKEGAMPPSSPSEGEEEMESEGSDSSKVRKALGMPPVTGSGDSMISGEGEPETAGSPDEMPEAGAFSPSSDEKSDSSSEGTPGSGFKTSLEDMLEEPEEDGSPESTSESDSSEEETTAENAEDSSLSRESKLAEDGEKESKDEEFESLEEELVKENEEELELREEVEDLNGLMDEIDFSDLHDGITHKIIRPKVTNAMINAHDSIAPHIQKLAKLAARKADYFMEDTDPIEVRGKYTGNKFHASQVVKGNLRYFSKVYDIEPAPTLSVIVRVDESGSMGGTKEEIAMRTALFLYYFCKEKNIPIAIYGDTEVYPNGWGFPVVELHCYTEFDSDSKDDAYRLCDISARSNNRDGYAIRFLKERLSEQDTEKKLLIVISDGAPAAANYGGSMPEVVEEFHAICKECDREGIGYIAAAIDGDKESIAKLYGERHFMDITDLNQLPETLCSVIRRLLR